MKPRCDLLQTAYATDSMGREVSAAGINPEHVILSARTHCATHGMPVPDALTTTGGSPRLCPIGKIEEATEKALSTIEGVDKRLATLERIAVLLSCGAVFALGIDDKGYPEIKSGDWGQLPKDRTIA